MRQLKTSSLRKAVCNALSALLLSAPLLATADVNVNLSAAYHYDTRGFGTASVLLSVPDLPANLSLWGFTDWHGDHDSNDLHLTRSFSEYRLSYNGTNGLFGVRGAGLQAEWDGFSGGGNDVTRLGLTYRHSVGLPWLPAGHDGGWLQWRMFPYETDNDGGQVSLIFFLPINERMKVIGFADYNVSERGSNRWVIEPELNIALSDRWSALLELRYNGYEDANPNLRGTSLALGVRYQFRR